MSVTLGPKIPVMSGAIQGDLYTNQGNALLRAIQALMQANVISVGLTTPPSSPSDGDMYVVGVSATGIWSEKDNSIAYWSLQNPLTPSGEWEFYIPLTGWALGNHADGLFYVFNGTSWIPTVGSGTQNARTFLAGPISGSPASASFRTISPSDLNSAVTLLSSSSTYTVQDSDRGKLLSFVFNSGNLVTVTLPQPGGGQFGSSWFVFITNRISANGQTKLQLIPTSATINNDTSVTVFPGGSALIWSDGSNFYAIVIQTDGMYHNLAFVGTTYTATSLDETIVVVGGASFTISLPNSSGTKLGKLYTIKQSGTGTIVVNSPGTTFDGQASITLATQNEAITVQWDGGAWQIVGSNPQIVLNSTVPSLPFLSTISTFSDSPLFRFDANTIEQRNLTNPQTSIIYKSYTDASNNHGLSITGNTVQTFQNGVDTADSLTLNTNGSFLSLAFAGVVKARIDNLGLSLINSAKVHIYSDQPTAGVGTPPDVANLQLNNHTDATRTDTIFTTSSQTGSGTLGGEGNYDLLLLYQCRVAQPGASLTVTLTWSDQNTNVHTKVFILNLNNTANEFDAHVYMNVQNSTSIVVQSVITGGGTGAYDARFDLIQVSTN